MAVTLPDMMNAVEITEPGGPEVLKPTKRPVPLPGRGEVLIRVEAAGVNRPDVAQRQGNYPVPPGVTDIPGLEIAGKVVGFGPGAARLSGAPRQGASVCALVAGGGYAEYCVAPVAQCLPVPRGMDMVAAAAVPETFFTVWDNLFTRGGLAKGKSCLVHGGSSGIGTTAIQLAKAFGATCYVTAGTDAKCRACKRLGADRAINYRDEDFVAVIKEATGGKGVDVILDMVGGRYFERNLDSLAVEGTLVHIAVLGGAKAEIPIYKVMGRRLTVTGSTLRPRTVAQKAVITADLRKKVWPLLNAGKVKPLIHKKFRLKDADKAHALMESSTHIGKIVLTI